MFLTTALSTLGSAAASSAGANAFGQAAAGVAAGAIGNALEPGAPQVHQSQKGKQKGLSGLLSIPTNVGAPNITAPQGGF